MLKRKKGDTLVEVMLAVGIFSLVAIVVTSVVSGSTSSAQTALEATLAREEVDAQAEALRFIHAAYISNPEGDFKRLWENGITYGAITELNDSYPPSSCETMYENIPDNAFVINPRMLGSIDDENLRAILIKNNGSSGQFTTASTYPHLVYDNENKELVKNSSDNVLYRAEGIYDIAVAGPDYGDTGVPQYYDFYIRTCWYGTGDRNASTISTVIRLYNPAVMLPTGS